MTTYHRSERLLTIFITLIALPVALLGLVFLTQATTGVGLLAFACFLAILARIDQARAQHAELLSAHDFTVALSTAQTK